MGNRDIPPHARAIAFGYAVFGSFFLLPPILYWHANMRTDLVSLAFGVAHLATAVAIWRLPAIPRAGRVALFAAAVAFAGWAVGRFGKTAYAWGFVGSRVPNEIIWAALLYQAVMAPIYIYYAFHAYKWALPANFSSSGREEA